MRRGRRLRHPRQRPVRMPSGPFTVRATERRTHGRWSRGQLPEVSPSATHAMSHHATRAGGTHHVSLESCVSARRGIACSGARQRRAATRDAGRGVTRGLEISGSLVRRPRTAAPPDSVVASIRGNGGVFELPAAPGALASGNGPTDTGESAGQIKRRCQREAQPRAVGAERSPRHVRRSRSGVVVVKPLVSRQGVYETRTNDKCASSHPTSHAPRSAGSPTALNPEQPTSSCGSGSVAHP